MYLTFEQVKYIIELKLLGISYFYFFNDIIFIIIIYLFIY